MRPSGTTGAGSTTSRRPTAARCAAALAGVSLIEAPSAQDEAEAIALILREAAETPGRTAALVSPDRLLARRVAVRLEAWGIRVDDSAGRPFAKTAPGTFLDLVIDAVAEDFAPAEVMALLKHPLTRLGLDAVRRAPRGARAGDRRLPHVYLGRGLDGVAAALERAERKPSPAGARRQRAVDAPVARRTGRAAHDLVARLKAAFAPLTAFRASAASSRCRPFAAAHIAAAEALAALPEAEATRSRLAAVAGRSRRRRRELLRRPPRPAAAGARRSPPATTPTSTAASSPARTCARASPCIRASPSGARSRRACSRPTS